MEREIAEEVFAACENALARLTDVEVAIAKISDSEERAKLMHVLSVAIAEILAGVRAPVVLQYPEIQPFDDQDAAPYEPDQEEIELMRAATDAQGDAVDQLVLRECTNRWEKVAKIVGNLIPEFEQSFPHLPFVYMLARMDELEDLGKLEVAGNVWSMRYSEIRLLQPGAGVA
ncbi:DUF3658 domain-containing protein [Rhizobacter sp. Root1221]|uniref:DUF3658 domain-containing protein n=1 Tax=Rhizobacter sp. Root1221 TaxID=1736433 RepID=UPI0006FC1354|nr:DUF3658 domain-containing protein [Rhizobacter sp. Root1221]